MATLSPLPKFQFLSNGGVPLAGGKLFSYQAGTTAKQTTYTDSTGAVPNTNPIVLDAYGRCDCWLDPSKAYKFVLSPSTDTDPPTNPIWTVDNVTPLGSSVPWTIVTGTADAILAAYTPPNQALTDGLLLSFRALAANATTTPTFAPDALVAHPITRMGGIALQPGDIPANLAEVVVRYNLANTRWELLNPASPESLVTTKGDIVVATAAKTMARQAAGSNGQIAIYDSTQTNGMQPGNLIQLPKTINPNWLVDQINEGTAVSVAAATVQGPDGWSGKATGAGTFTMQRVADPANAALLAMKLACTVADAAIGAADDYTVYTAIEGFDVADLKIGTASAGQISLRVKMQFPAAGTYGVWLQNSANDRSYVQVLTVPDANENEYTLTWTLDLAGTWLYTNGVGLYLGLCLASGSNFQTAANAWAAGNFRTTVAQTNFMALNTNVAYIKRVHLVPGPVPLPYAPQDFHRELTKAQRYYAKTFAQGTAPGQNVTAVGELSWAVPAANASGWANWRFPITMRAAPTVVTYNPAAANANWRDHTTASDLVVTVDPATALSPDGVVIASITTNPGGANIVGIHATANARLS